MTFALSKYIHSKRLQRDVALTFLFGTLSVVFRLINFEIPGIEGVQSDLRELPLLIGIIHLTNPLYSFGMSAISSISFSTTNDHYIYTFLGHAIPLFVLWFFFKALQQQKFNGFLNALAGLFLVVVYYLFSCLLALVVPDAMIIGVPGKNFLETYISLFKGASFEMIYTAIAISFYYVQLELRRELQEHKLNLEKTVHERTEHLNMVIEELRTAQNHLVQSEKMVSLGTLTAGMAHEINNPLNFISGGINIIRDIKPEFENSLSEEQNEHCNLAINIITEGLDRSINIVNTLMSFSGVGESRLENKDINQLIDNTLLFMKGNIPADIVISKEYELEDLVPVYVEKMHQVFINILNNAIFALGAKEQPEKQIVIKTYRGNSTAVIEIFNTGPEIPSGYLGRIFDPFFTTKEPGKGKGLGLAICYTYIKEHKGEIRVSNLENGVCFIIELPLEQSFSNKT
ncbi:MAG: ATP-binding protein [Bacteroidales bacterium]